MLDSQLRYYIKYGHKRVNGWLLDGAMKMIEVINKGQYMTNVIGNVAEIGVHHGKLFILLRLLARNEERALAIDLFEDQASNVDGSGEGNRQRLIANLHRFADLHGVVIHQSNSMNIDADRLVSLAGGPCRLISIDGGHTAEITFHDLCTAEGAISTDGVIILDDLFNEMWPGVSEGTHRFFSTPRNIVPFAIGGNKTFFCKSSGADYYKSILNNITLRQVDRQLFGNLVRCCDFTPLSFTEKLGQTRPWRVIKDFPGVRFGRRLLRGRYGL
jgi:hypothetical protein